MKKFEILLLTAILLGAFITRLYHFQSPLADWHSWRQVDTSSVSREYVLHGIDLLHPTYHDLSSIPSGKDNPKGYRFVEFPLFNALQAIFYMDIGIFSLEQWGRMISIGASLGGIVFLYLFVRRYYGITVGLFSAFFFAFLPFNIYYHRTVLPDTSMTTAVLGSIYFFDLWCRDKKIVQYGSALLLSIVALLLKPYAAFFLIPIVYLVYYHYGFLGFSKKLLWLFGLTAVLPLLLWRLWMLQYPEGIPHTGWLFNSGGIRFSGAYVYWIFGERIAKLILGYWGCAFLLIGLVYIVPRKVYGIGGSFLCASVLYLIIIASGNVQHDYYQILIMPSLSLFLGIGASIFFTKRAFFHHIVSKIVGTFVIVLMFSLSWYHIREYFVVNDDVVTVGKEVDRLLPKDAKIVTWTLGDTTLLYQTQRKGWPAYTEPLEAVAQKGASYLVLLHPTEKDYNLKRTFPLFAQGEKYAIFTLPEK